MSRIREATRRGLTVGLLLLAGGCARTPHSDGTWTGYVVPTSLYDKGTEYQAAALRVTSGPEIPPAINRGGIDNHHGWLPAPVLVREDDEAIDFNSFPAGQPLSVCGTGSQNFAYVGEHQTAAFRPNVDPKSYNYWHPLIVVRKVQDAHGNRIVQKWVVARASAS